MSERTYNWEEARIHVQALLAGYKGFQHADEILGAANEASHELTVLQRDLTAVRAEIAQAKADRELAVKATKEAKRVQSAAEQAQTDAVAKAEQYQSALAKQMREGEATFMARATEQEQVIQRRRDTADQTHRLRLEEIAQEQARAEGKLAEAYAALRAVGIDPAALRERIG